MIDRLRERTDRLVADTVADLGPAADPAEIADVVGRLLDAVAGGRRLRATELERLREDGVAAARAGRPLGGSIDGWLSAAWVAWDAAVGLAGEGDATALAELGSALLRAGDDAAAALADGYTRAERSLAARAGALRRGVLDELLTPVAAGGAGGERRARRAALAGIDPAQPCTVLVVRAERELADEGPEAEELARRLGRDPSRRPVLAAVREGDLVLIAGGGATLPPGLPAALEAIGPLRWWAAAAEPGPLDTLPARVTDALDALRVIPACRPAGTIVPAAEVALERALVADPALAAAGIERWLGPLRATPRDGDALVATVEAWLTAACSTTATARTLGVAPRTVTYRLDRAARCLGVRRLDAPVRERLSAALLARRLLGGAGIPPAGMAMPDTPAALAPAAGAAGPASIPTR